jgi:hypothetical protein
MGPLAGVPGARGLHLRRLGPHRRCAIGQPCAPGRHGLPAVLPSWRGVRGAEVVVALSRGGRVFLGDGACCLHERWPSWRGNMNAAGRAPLLSAEAEREAALRPPRWPRACVPLAACRRREESRSLQRSPRAWRADSGTLRPESVFLNKV